MRRHRHSASNYIFSEVPRISVPRSSFVRESTHSTTLNCDYLVPVYFDEFYPGDTLSLNASALIRLNSAPVVPIMDDIYLSVDFFAVPFRLLWTHWINLQGERELIDDSSDKYTTPQLVAPSTGFEFESVADYLGLPPGVPNISVSALPFRCYNKIYNYWYRDENLINPISDNMADTGDTVDMYPLQKRAKVHDYFTSALPSPQKGEPPTISITGNAPVVDSASAAITVPHIYDYTSQTPVGSVRSLTSNALSEMCSVSATSSPSSALAGFRLEARLDNLQAVTVNQLRFLFASQRILEKDARGGTRYPEMILTHFGVTSPDSRQQRPELLYSASQRMFVNPVVQQSATQQGDTPQGNLAAYVVGNLHAKGFTKSFTEHTYVMGIASIRTSNKYQQGIPRIFSRKTRLDYYLPATAHLGEQAILNKEIYAQGTDADEDVFGYQERWAELRYKNSIISGKLRSTFSESLDLWHLGQHFTSLPALNQNFIESNVPISRITSVNPEQESAFIMDMLFTETDVRPMPLNSVPGLIDHY